MRRILLVLIFVVGGCSANEEIFTTADVSQFCSTIDGQTISHDDLIGKLAHVNLTIDSMPDRLLHIQALAPDERFEDKCWHDILYNTKTEVVEHCSKVCN